MKRRGMKEGKMLQIIHRATQTHKEEKQRRNELLLKQLTAEDDGKILEANK